MTTLEQTASPTGHQPARRPSAWRKFGAFYLDLLFASFLGWIVCNAFASRGNWATVSVILYFLQNMICRGTFKPTMGDFFMGIRYLASSSNEVVADIRIINPKSKLNGFLLWAGLFETTWAILGLSLWTFLDRAVFMGRMQENPKAFLYYIVLGLLMFVCAALLLGASQNARWAVPLVHACILLELFQSAAAWINLIPSIEITLPWAEKAAQLASDVPSIFILVFAVWSVVVSVGVFFTRKILVN
jgi:hypothetical protein